MHGVSAIAEQLGDHDMHVYLLPYERRLKRLPLQNVLGAYLGITGSEVVLVDGEFGRPQLDRDHGATLGFNWSHSGDCALIAIGRQCAPGVDIERRRARARALDIAEHYFCEAEFAVLAATPEDARGAEFLRLWTAKEAVLKAMGRGIAFGLDRLHVESVQARPVLRWLDDDDVSAWQLQCVDVGADYIAALAWRGAARDVQCWNIVC